MKCQYAEMQKISIHALREEGDAAFIIPTMPSV